MYFATFEVTDRGPVFVALRIVPFRLRKMRLERAARAESEPRVQACRRFGTQIVLLGSLVAPVRESSGIFRS